MNTAPTLLPALQRAEEQARADYSRAVDHERAVQRRLDELEQIADCPRCIHAELGSGTLLCGTHTGALYQLRQATKQRITAQRVLADAAWALRSASSD